MCYLFMVSVIVSNGIALATPFDTITLLASLTLS